MLKSVLRTYIIVVTLSRQHENVFPKPQTNFVNLELQGNVDIDISNPI